MEHILCSNHHMLQVINSFGFLLGFGDQTVKEACLAQKIDLETFLSVINFVHGPQNEEKEEWLASRHISLHSLVDYVERSHDYFLHYRLPATRRRLIEAMDCSGEDKIPYLFLKYFDLFLSEIEQHAHYENTQIHPYVEQLMQGIQPSCEQNICSLMQKQKAHHRLIRKKMSDLIQVIVKYYKNKKKNQQMNDVLYELFVMEEDFECHSLIEERVFTTCVLSLEEKTTLAHEQNKQIRSAYPEKSLTTFDQLSKREKEIICLVTQGLSNKQIASQLGISINTVLTHRRHINKKLEIHSPAELTIHAILNGLVPINEIE